MPPCDIIPKALLSSIRSNSYNFKAFSWQDYLCYSMIDVNNNLGNSEDNDNRPIPNLHTCILPIPNNPCGYSLFDICIVPIIK